MDNTLKIIGERIKAFRKIKGLTLEEFASRINKSRSTVSKYENGLISIDIVTLLDICNELNITISQLTDFKTTKVLAEDKKRSKNFFYNSNEFYLYYYDGRRKKLVKGFITLQKNETSYSFDAMLYLNISDFSDYTKCKHLYHGKFNEYDTISNFVFENQNIDMENLMIVVANPIGISTQTVALLAGVYSQLLLPSSLKCVLSKHPLKESDELIEQLKLTKDDLRDIKKVNMFAVHNRNS